MSREAWRPHIEDALVLNMTDLRRLGFVDPHRPVAGTLTWTDHHGAPLLVASCSVILTSSSGMLSLSHTCIDPTTHEPRTAEYVIHLDMTRPQLGGMRWWFRCPRTGQRASKVYLFPRHEKFSCRTAIHPQPTYAIQRVSGLKKATQRRWSLRRRIGASDTLVLLGKPKFMRERTFARYEQRDIELEEDELRIARRRFGSVVGI